MRPTHNPFHHHTHTGHLSHRTCIAKSSEADTQKKFFDADPTKMKYQVEANNGRHDECYCLGHGKHNWKSRTIALAILRTCRQIYHEAKYIPIVSNTFAFNCPIVLSHFVQSMSKMSLKSHLAVRSLLLEMNVRHSDNESSWAAAIRNSLQRLRNLRSVSINVNQFFCDCWIEQCGYELRGVNELWMAILSMGIMKLKEATVVIGDEYFLDGKLTSLPWSVRPSGDERRWTLKEKQDWAKVVRAMLLGG
ncbi:MAG: hypothetical protein Q9217_003807 [Psora testacea]